MSDVPIQNGQGGPVRGPEGVRKSGQVPPSATTPSGSETRPAFKALLEKLEERARALQEETSRVEDSTRLAGAVEGARSSLEEALSLGEELLESFRQSQQQQTSAPATDEEPR